MNPDGAGVLARLVATLPDAAFALMSDGRLVCCNDAARALFPGLRENEPISRAVRAPEVLDAIRAARDVAHLATVWLHRVPIERQFDIRACTLDPELPGVVLVTLRDTTDLRRVERIRSDFVANASHELRTPLASLLGFVETLQGPARNDPAAQTRFLGIMGEQARRMSRLVDDLLSLSRIERSLHVRPDEAVDLSAVAAHICDALEPMASVGSVTLELDAPHEVIVRGDRDDLLRVTENLVDNAIKYGGPGIVTLRVRRENGAGCLSVEDRGPGMASEHIPRLTERFYRVDAEASRAKGGTGLGLAIVKHIVARHRGRLSIGSTPGQGATFSVAIPLEDG